MSKFDDFFSSHVDKAWDKYGQVYNGFVPQWYEPYAGQCVSLVMAYLRYLYGDKVRSAYGNAIDFWTSRNTNGILELCSVASSPQDGDIVVSAGSMPQYGHIWIYKSGQAFSQNIMEDPRARLYPLSWQGEIYGILRPKNLSAALPTLKKEPSGSVYRLYNFSNGDHLYTVDHNEALACLKAGWKDEGVAWTSPDKGQTVERLYNPYNSIHHFTTDQSEKAALVRLGWKYEGRAFFSGGNRPIYRMYNPNTGSHVLTAEQSEHDGLSVLGWVCEGQPMRY